MKTIPVALLNHLALPTTTLAPCVVLTRIDGVVVRATDHDQDLVIDGEVYRAVRGGTATDVDVSTGLAVDNGELRAPYRWPAIEAELRAGTFDFARYSRFLVNYDDPDSGRYRQQDGRLGRITLERGGFAVEQRGLAQALQQGFGRFCSPQCPYTLGDADCTVELDGSPPSFTVTGTLAGFTPDGLTLFDPVRTEPGPAGGVAITGWVRGNPTRLGTASQVGTEGSVVTISDVVGPVGISGTWAMRNVDGTSFDIEVDTSDADLFPDLVSGTATPLGAESGYFDFGVFTVTDGDSDNAGRSREIKSYVPGQWTLWEALPYRLRVGEAYALVAGCDKTAPTCKAKFDNLLNFGGDPFVPGQDSIMQVGRHA